MFRMIVDTLAVFGVFGLLCFVLLVVFVVREENKRGNR